MKLSSLSLNSDQQYLNEEIHNNLLNSEGFYPTRTPNSKSYLKVSDHHTLFYATYGNPSGVPLVVLHGGPAAGCSDALTRFFDLTFWHVIMFDQRGSPQSLPQGCMIENTPQHLVSDIEKLKKHLKIDQWFIFGGSWGSTLGLLYGEQYPDSCLGFILRGIFLGRQQDILHLFEGMGKVFPEAYDVFIKYIPVEEHNDLLTAYYRRIMHSDSNIHLPAAQAFMRYDIICSTHLPDEKNLQTVIDNSNMILSVARAFLHYAYHQFFLKPDQILLNINRIVHLPSIIVHGRWDAICLPENAYTLHKNLTNSLLWMIPDGGHTPNEPAIGKALVRATDLFKINIDKAN